MYWVKLETTSKHQNDEHPSLRGLSTDSFAPFIYFI